MISEKVIKKIIDDLKMITNVDLCVIESSGKVCATTFECNHISKTQIDSFLESKYDEKRTNDYNFFKVNKSINCIYIVITKAISQECYTMGKVCVSQLNHLIVAYRDSLNKNSFIQNLLLDNIILVDIYNYAKQLKIENSVNRVVMIVKAYDHKDSSSLEMIKNIFAENERDYITSIDEKSIVIIKDIGQDKNYREVEKVANILVDMFNTEIMVKAKVSYGKIVSDLKEISKSYKEAKISMEVGDIFYNEKNIIGYDSLGIGRLIYQLPVDLCKMFIDEVFKDNMADEFDDETIATIYKFFENNLNISETARKLYVHRNTLVYRLDKIEKITGLDIKAFDDALTFKLALMIVSYIKYLNNKTV